LAYLACFFLDFLRYLWNNTKIYAVVLEQVGVPDHRNIYDGVLKYYQLVVMGLLAAIKFNVSESSKFSPYFLIYNRDPLLPIDNILKPRRKYYGDQEHQLALEQQHKSLCYKSTMVTLFV
jgi:hypothetical protein